ncbi:hypothetical protein SLS62_007232 [Diatrype stigma]|uniref:Uncharacterized protein n=1 Tax=Diatrype stigma TaxID=117547 RepID=A0AAN9UZQ1_9PEZI
MIYQVDVKLSEQNMPELSSRLWNSQARDFSNRQFQIFTVKSKSDHVVLLFRDGVTFGILRDNMFKALSPMLQREKSLVFEGVAITHLVCDRLAKVNKSSDRIVQVDLNVYGLREDAKRIGNEFSSKKIWLQRPDRARLPYENPHVITFPGMEHSISIQEVQANSGAKNLQAEEERVQQIVSEVQNSLQRANELETTTGDRRLKTQLLDLQPEERGGGILADEMGMGKSLCLLALVLETLDEGRKWAEEKQLEEHHCSRVQYSHSTLVIVPSALLINNWWKEIETHMEGILKVIKYHGQGRESNPDNLKNSDVVITTYSTLASEWYKKKSQLHRIAHVIRRPATTFYRTCTELEARSRWALTGTPIQNRLQDIGALFAFLRAEPFHSIAQFRRFISVPFDQGNPIVKDRLVMLYDSLCLRRTKDILTLPGVKEEIRRLDFSQEEREHYEGTVKILDRSIRERVGQYDQVSKFGLFQAHLQLRILCNHGTYQKAFSWKRSRVRDTNEALTVDLGMDVEVRCNGCEQLRPLVGPSNTSSKDCGHFLCSSCQGDYEGSWGLDSVKCPLCSLKGRDGQGQLTGASFDAPNHTDPPETHKSREDGYFNKNGTSAKMKALIEDVKRDQEKVKRTLDLVEQHLKLEGIVPIRIDGNTLMSERQRSLDKFDTDAEARVLLMTTGTGAFGLNITAAKRVFIVELQWNPSVENQAIARTIRLGQEENVLVTRYMIKGTVEEVRSRATPPLTTRGKC